MPDWIKEGGPIAIVALGAIWMFLQAFNKWGDSRDKEREAFLKALQQQTEASINGVLALVGLATQMVNACQSHQHTKQRVTTAEIMEAAERATPPKGS